MYAKLNAALGKLIFGTLFLLVVVTTQAQTSAPAGGENHDSTLVKYLGAQDDMIVFNVAYKNPEGTP